MCSSDLVTFLYFQSCPMFFQHFPKVVFHGKLLCNNFCYIVSQSEQKIYKYNTGYILEWVFMVQLDKVIYLTINKRKGVNENG